MRELVGHRIISNKKMGTEFQDILKKHNISRVLVVSGTTYERTYLKEWFSQMPFEFIQFSNFSPNPKYEEICEGTKLFLESKCDLIIAVGGGSAIDTAKSIKLFSVMDSSQNYLEQELKASEVPFICIPTTAGSGSEANGNVVLYVNGQKRNLFHKSCIPDYIYFEPEFLDTLPDYIKRSSFADAVAQCIESIWAKNGTEESIQYAETGLRLLLDHAMQYLRGEKSAYEAIQMGAFYSGKAIGIGKTTATHALSYKLSQDCGLAHGHAVFLLLPSVYKMTAERAVLSESILKERIERINKIIYPAAESNEDVKIQLDFIYRVLGLEIPDFVGEEKLREYIRAVNLDRLGNHPIPLSEGDLYNLYLGAFRMVRDDNGNLKEDEAYKESADRQKFVKGLQKLTLDTLLLTQKFLEENHLTFFLGEGTMLGAVRHHGFIPWDDDVDILMPRDDYERLVELAKEGKVPPELNFDALENNDKHWVLGAKMQLVRETEYVQEKVIPLSRCHGPYVDIFPLDYWPKAFGMKLRMCDLNVKICRRMLFMKTGYSKATKKKIFRILLRFICFFVSNRQIENFAMRNMKKYRYGERKYMVNLCSYYPFYKQVFPVGCFSDCVSVAFEGHTMPLPKEYDYILKTIYGVKYDSIPPYTVTNMRQHAFKLKERN